MITLVIIALIIAEIVSIIEHISVTNSLQRRIDIQQTQIDQLLMLDSYKKRLIK